MTSSDSYLGSLGPGVRGACMAAVIAAASASVSAIPNWELGDSCSDRGRSVVDEATEAS